MSQEFSCKELLEATGFRLDLKLCAGSAGLDNLISSHRIQKPGLSLAGYTGQVQKRRVQVLGSSELEFLDSLPEDKREEPLRKLFSLGLACFIVTKGLDVPEIILAEAERTDTPVFSTPLRTTMLIERVERFMENKLAIYTHLHGVLVDIMGVGVLMRGPSGVGKSECAMDLVLRGYRLVADDVVRVWLKPPFRLIGSGCGIIRYNMEIRGLGVIDIQELFGLNAIRAEKAVDLVVDLVLWEEGESYDRLGLDDQMYSIMDVEVPYLRIPVAPGRNIAAVVEVAARNHMLKMMGHNSAIKMAQKLESALLKEGKDK